MGTNWPLPPSGEADEIGRLAVTIADICVEWPVPDGTRRLKIDAILYQPEAAGHGPAALFVSGRRAPCLDREGDLQPRTDEEVVAEIREYQRTSTTLARTAGIAVRQLGAAALSDTCGACPIRPMDN